MLGPLLSQSPIWFARTDDEISIVCRPDPQLATRAEVSEDWAAIKVHGPIEHTVVGLLADISSALASESITLFALSTFDTDYVLVRTGECERALTTLGSVGYEVVPEPLEQGPTSAADWTSKGAIRRGRAGGLTWAHRVRRVTAAGRRTRTLSRHSRSR
jgi:hypothetical protein